MLRDLSDRQSEVHELLASLRAKEDKTIEEGLAGNLGYDDGAVTAVVLSVLEMAKDPDREVIVNDLIWAGAFLDHLDTQGMAVRRKPKTKKKHNGR